MYHFIVTLLLLISSTNAVHLQGTANLNEQQTHSACEIPQLVTTTKKDFTDIVEKSEQCVEHMEELEAYLRELQGDIFDPILEAREIIEDAQDTIEKLDNTLDKFSAFLNNIPKVKTALRLVRTKLDSISSGLEKVLDRTERIEDVNEKISESLDQITRVIGEANTFSGKLSAGSTFYHTAASCASADSSCNSYTALAALGATSGPFLGAGIASFEGCITALDKKSYPNVKALIIKNVDSISAIVDIANSIVSWVDGIVDDLVGTASYQICCQNGLKEIKNVFANVLKAFSLATCWFEPIENGVLVTLDAIKSQKLSSIFDTLEGINGLLPDINSLLDVVDDIEVPLTLVDLQTRQDAQELLDKCNVEQFVEDTSISSTVVKLATEKLNFVVSNSPLDSGLQNAFSNLWSNIKESCDNAAKAFRDQTDCCDIARTCDPEHQIVLYEGDECTQNIAGTLDHPTKKGRSYSTNANDRLCIANDESRSLKLFGPLKAGISIRIRDSTDTSCKDDVSTIILKEDIAAGKDLCIKTFHDTFSKSNVLQSTFFVNGLGGKASRFEVRYDNVGSLKVACGANAYLRENDNCKGNVVGVLPQSTSLKFASSFKNDAARSALFLGPIKKGTRLEVGDHSSADGRDDFASITIRKDIAAGSKLCVSSLEKEVEYSTYATSVSKVNGLNGKVSRATMQQNAKFVSASYRRKWSKYFSEEEKQSDRYRTSPIEGMYCSGNSCDKKSILHARSSTAYNGYHSTTKEFSEEHKSMVSCPSGTYVGRIYCNKSKCDNLKLGCYKLKSPYRLSTTKYYYISNDQGVTFPAGYILTGIQCFNGHCSKLKLKTNLIYST